MEYLCTITKERCLSPESSGTPSREHTKHTHSHTHTHSTHTHTSTHSHTHSSTHSHTHTLASTYHVHVHVHVYVWVLGMILLKSAHTPTHGMYMCMYTYKLSRGKTKYMYDRQSVSTPFSSPPHTYTHTYSHTHNLST